MLERLKEDMIEEIATALKYEKMALSMIEKNNMELLSEIAGEELRHAVFIREIMRYLGMEIAETMIEVRIEHISDQELVRMLDEAIKDEMEDYEKYLEYAREIERTNLPEELKEECVILFTKMANEELMHYNYLRNIEPF